MNKRYLAFALLIGATGIAQQQVDSTRLQVLDEVVVSDSRFELKRAQSGKTVIKISAEELERNQGRSVAELITTKSGLEIAGSRSRQGEILGVFARGGRGRQVLILVDGLRVSDPSSFSQEYDLRLLPTSNIASIEIIKGAASTLYGTNAATAVINIKTKGAPDRRLAGEFMSSLGTNQTAGDQNYNIGDFHNSARLSGTLEKFSYALAVANNYSGGISSIITPQNEEDVFSRTSTDLRLGYSFSENFNLNVYANNTNLRTDYDESFGLTDTPYEFLSEQKRLGLSSRLLYTKGELNLNLAYADYTSENISAFPNTFSGNNLVLDIFNKYVLDKRFYGILGLNYNKDQSEFESIRDFTIYDPYLNVVYLSSFGLNINAGSRLNLHSEYDSNFVYNINPSYSIKTESGYVKLLSSYATSYITPSLTQLFGEFGANPSLEPETNRTLEAGLELAGKRQLRASILYFNRKEENFVFFDNSSFQYLNADNVIDAEGVEIELNWKPCSKFQWSANYTFTERKGDSGIRIPKHKINTLLGYTFSERSFASINYAYNGARTDTDFNTFTDVSLEPYSLLGCFVSHSLIPGKLKVFLNVDNLLNTAYTEVIGFNTRGRNMRLGINLRL